MGVALEMTAQHSPGTGDETPKNKSTSGRSPNWNEMIAGEFLQILEDALI
jgi:hypothetical protein